ncbi:hypothetical protein L1049_008181 [Liquidambar formosana]|uniref:Uncharacterized protein n=1 Tax=Liquidambar formosana TaxID=63359 RepID=A0AAP0X846_LIQFO
MVARSQIEQASNMRKRLTSPHIPGLPTATTNPPTETTRIVEPNLPSIQPSSTPPQPSLTQPVISFAPMKTIEEENKKAAAAAVAAKLAASTSSAQMLTSVLSSLVAEEAASMNGGINSAGFTSGLPMFSQEKRPKLEKPMPVSDNISDGGNSAYFTPLQQPMTNMPVAAPTSMQPMSQSTQLQPMTNMPVAAPTSMQPMSQSTQLQALFPPPPPPPPAPLSPVNPSANQYVQSTGLMVGIMPYGYAANTLPPPPPLPPHIAMGLARSAPQPLQQPQPQQTQQQQASGGYYRPPGIGFYGQSHQPTTPPVPRQ